MNWLRVLQERYRETADPIRTERRIELVVVLLALVLILQLVYGASRLSIISTPGAVVPTADSLQVMNPLGQNTVTAEQSNEIRNRPLLWPGRRPVAPPVVEVAEVAVPEIAKQQEPLEIKLLGVFGGGDTAGIIGRVKDKTQRIRLGQEVAGWTLVSVGKTEAVFTADSRKETIKLLPGQIKIADKVEK